MRYDENAKFLQTSTTLKIAYQVSTIVIDRCWD